MPPGMQGGGIERSTTGAASAGERWVAWLVAAITAAAVAGCQSVDGGSGHASVRITGPEIAAIRLTTREVFNAAGYGLGMSLPDSMTFQRLGGVGDAVLYGGWDGDGVTQRVKVQFQSSSATDCVLVATAYSVRDAGDRVMEEENRKWVLNRGPYKKLLGEIKRRLETPGLSATP